MASCISRWLMVAFNKSARNWPAKVLVECHVEPHSFPICSSAHESLSPVLSMVQLSKYRLRLMVRFEVVVAIIIKLYTVMQFVTVSDGPIPRVGLGKVR